MFNDKDDHMEFIVHGCENQNSRKMNLLWGEIRETNAVFQQASTGRNHESPMRDQNQKKRAVLPQKCDNKFP